jgi:hypothetical protein
VPTNRLLVLASGNAHYFYGIMTNAGTIQLSNGGGDLYLEGSCGGGIGELINLPGALVDVQGNNSIYSAGCNTELVVNQGVLRKSGGTGTTYIQPTFNNSGTLDVKTGTVSLYNGQGSGVYLPEAGATLIFSQNYEVDNDLTGAGTILLNGGTFTLNGNINGSNVVMNGANLLASNTVINSALTWNSGQINAGSVVTVATNRLLVLASGNAHYFYGIMTNAGTIQLSNGGGDLYLYGSCAGGIGELVNLPGALVDVQGNNSIYSAGCNTELVVNQGVLRKSGGTGTTTLNPAFVNTGTLDAQSGNIALQGAYTLANGTKMGFGLDGSAGNGSISLSGAASFVGSVSINLKGFFWPGVGGSFNLLNYTSETGLLFTNMTLPAAGYITWQTNYNPTAFTLSVLAHIATNTVSTNLFISKLNPTNIILQWPGDHTGWRVQGQTNPVTVGLYTNWSALAGSSLTNQIVMPIDKTNGTVFFRMIYP